MIVDSIYSHLASDAGVAAIVGTKVFPLTIPQEYQAPAIVYTLDEDNLDPLLDEIGPLRRALVSVDCYSTSHVQAHQLADAVETAVNGYRGPLGSKTAERMMLVRRLDLFEPGTLLYRVSLQISVAYY